MTDGPGWQRFFCNEQRLRSGWRILLFALLLVVLGSVGISVVGLLPAELAFWAIHPVLLAATVLSGWIMLAQLERRPLGALGLALTPATPRELGWGTAIGGGLIVAVTFVLGLAGAVHWVVEPGAAAEYLRMMLGSLLFFAVAAAWEEALFRGYAFQVLVEGIGAWPAILLSSAVFAWVHGQNPAVTWLALANIFLAGVLLAIAYLRTRSLWFATAVHLGWNWTMAFLLDLPVSGFDRFDTPGYSGVEAGPAWLSGGEFGPEGGLAATLVLLAGTVWLLRTRSVGVAEQQQQTRPIVDRRLPPEGL